VNNGDSGERREPTRGLAAWCFYDWANSAFPTVIMTFVFAAYFTKGVAVDEVTGTSQWGWAVSASAFAIAVVAPILGAVADRSGRRKPWLLFFTLACAVASAGLWTIEPDTAFVIRALVLVALANFAFELGMVFYNAMLPDLARPERIGRWSGWGWGLGYFGGLSCLGLVLVGFVQADTPWFGLDKDNVEHLRVVGMVVGVWMVLFSAPLFLMTPDKGERTPLAQAVRSGMATLIETFRQIRRYREVGKFLIARMIYTDGLNTLFAFGGIYAVGSFGFSFEDLILFGIGINVTAGIGAALFAWGDDRFGSKRVIYVSVGSLIILGGILLVIEGATLFWLFGLALGIFVGPAQSASRSMMARMSPVELRTEMFGLYALSGKATAFLGPALLAMATDVFDSQRAGMATILIFFIGGLALLTMVREPGR